MTSRSNLADGTADDEPGLRSPERGYIVAQTALLLIPMLIFAAFATDIGYWYVQGQKTQRAADAAALAGVAMLPDYGQAEAEARAVAARNGFTDATPGSNSDFDTGPLPQIEVTVPREGTLEVRIKREEGSFLGQVVLETIVVERFAVADFISPLHMGNPSSALGTGTIPSTSLGVPPDLTWIALNSYCTDLERGDHKMAGFTNGILAREYLTCGPGADPVLIADDIPNPNFDPDAYVFVAEMSPGTGPIDVSVYEPGVACADGTAAAPATGDSANAPRIYYRVYGPNIGLNHREFVNNNAPIAEGLFAKDTCIAASPAGDGWYPMATGLTNPSTNGGFYYVQLAVRNPVSTDLDPTDDFMAESGINSMALKATRNGNSQACIFSTADTTCPKLYALDWLPLFRELDNSEDEFFVAEIPERHAGNKVQIQVFDAADGAESIQIADPADQSVPFEFRYADSTLLQLSIAGTLETSFAPLVSTCTWNAVGGKPCLLTQPFADFNDHMLQLEIDIPTTYTCGGDCWWKVRYKTGGATGDRTNWSIRHRGDPIRLVE